MLMQHKHTFSMLGNCHFGTYASVLFDRSAGLVLAELLVLHQTRDEVERKRPLVAGITQEAEVRDSVERSLRAALARTPETPFRKDVIDALLDPEPRTRSSVRVAYANTQHMLKMCQARLAVSWTDASPYRGGFWRRLQRLFASATSLTTEQFQLQRSRPGSVIFHFRIIAPDVERVVAQLESHRCDPGSVFRQDEIGKLVLKIKLWEITDGISNLISH